MYLLSETGYERNQLKNGEWTVNRGVLRREDKKKLSQLMGSVLSGSGENAL